MVERRRKSSRPQDWESSTSGLRAIRKLIFAPSKTTWRTKDILGGHYFVLRCKTISLYPECECTSPKCRTDLYSADFRTEAYCLVLERLRQPVAHQTAVALAANENPRHASSFPPRFRVRQAHGRRHNSFCTGLPLSCRPTDRTQGLRWILNKLQLPRPPRVVFQT